MTAFFNHKNSFLLGATAGAAVYGATLYTSPSIIYATNFIIGSALISLLGPVAAAAMGWALPFVAVLAMGGLAAWLISSLANMISASKNQPFHHGLGSSSSDELGSDKDDKNALVQDQQVNHETLRHGLSM